MANWKRPACTLIANYPSYPKNRAEAEYARAFKIAKRTIFPRITLEAIVNVSIEKGQAKTRFDLSTWPCRRVSDRIPFRDVLKAKVSNHRPSRHTLTETRSLPRRQSRGLSGGLEPTGSPRGDTRHEKWETKSTTHGESPNPLRVEPTWRIVLQIFTT